MAVSLFGRVTRAARLGLTSLGLLLGSAGLAVAAMAVFDGTNLATAIQQLNSLLQQFEQAKLMVQHQANTIKAIGSQGSRILGTTTLLQNVQSGIAGIVPDAGAMKMPDGSKPQLGTVSQAYQTYKSVLYVPAVDPKRPLLPQAEIERAAREREAVVTDASLRGLALSAQTRSTVSLTMEEARDIQAKAYGDGAGDLRAQAAQTNRALAQLLTATAQQNALLAALLENIAAKNARDSSGIIGMAEVQKK